MQNPFVWHDLMTNDMTAAKNFYGKVVGWEFEAQRDDYLVLKAQGVTLGGIMAQPPEMKGMPPFWSGYVHVEDVDAACKKVKALGGKVVREPFDVPAMLRIAVIADPTGAMLNIMHPLTQGDMEKLPPAAVGSVGWNELHAGDLAVAWEFYSTLFGWTKGITMPMGEMGDYQLFQVDGKDTGGMMKRQEMLPAPMWLYYFFVDGIDAAVERVKAAGGSIAMEPHQVPGGNWIVSAFDPQGGSFQLLSLTK